MRKKADILMPEFLKLMIAVIVIGLLLYLAYQLYGIFIAKSDLEKARSTLNQIVGKIESLEEGEKIDYIINSPEGWNLLLYEDESLCDGEKCLCICEKKTKNNCKNYGVCKAFPYEYEPFIEGYFNPREIDNAQVQFGIYHSKKIFLSKNDGIIYFLKDKLHEKERDVLNNLLVYEFKKKKIESYLNDFINSGGNKKYSQLYMAIKDYFDNHNLKGIFKVETEEKYNEGRPIVKLGEIYFKFEKPERFRVQAGLWNIYKTTKKISDDKGNIYVISFIADLSNYENEN